MLGECVLCGTIGVTVGYILSILVASVLACLCDLLLSRLMVFVVMYTHCGAL